jgi:hypothetical protein
MSRPNSWARSNRSPRDELVSGKEGKARRVVLAFNGTLTRGRPVRISIVDRDG